jgi:hypothetical protein
MVHTLVCAITGCYLYGIIYTAISMLISTSISPSVIGIAFLSMGHFYTVGAYADHLYWCQRDIRRLQERLTLAEAHLHTLTNLLEQDHT